VVGQLDAEVGMLATPGTPLLVMGDLENLLVEIPLTEAMLERVSVGTPVQVRSEATGKEAAEAEVSRISPFLRTGSFSTVAEIDIADPGTPLRPGMFVTVDLLVGSSDQATLVPASALWEDPRSGRRGLFVVELPDGTATGAGESGTLSAESHAVAFRSVEVIAEGRGVAGVRGLDPGQWVVTVGQHLLGVEGKTRARVRPTSWERVLELQGLRREDLLQQFLAEQQRWARERGATPPDAAEFRTGGTPP
jgi:multidrug efflux pump subunit AcrA (membrane-fusion protein)